MCPLQWPTSQHQSGRKFFVHEKTIGRKILLPFSLFFSHRENFLPARWYPPQSCASIVLCLPFPSFSAALIPSPSNGVTSPFHPTSQLTPSLLPSPVLLLSPSPVPLPSPALLPSPLPFPTVAPLPWRPYSPSARLPSRASAKAPRHTATGRRHCRERGSGVRGRGVTGRGVVSRGAAVSCAREGGGARGGGRRQWRQWRAARGEARGAARPCGPGGP